MQFGFLRRMERHGRRILASLKRMLTVKGITNISRLDCAEISVESSIYCGGRNVQRRKNEKDML